jgi:hypothetical protein
MRFLVTCCRCSYGEFASDVVDDTQRCPYCGSPPTLYEESGKNYCWLHREPLAGSFPLSTRWLFTEYVWRGHEAQFPNAKLYEAFGDEPRSGTGSFCSKCQDVYELWLADRDRMEGEGTK